MAELVNQPTRRPTRKVLGGVAGAGATATVIWVAGLLGLEVPAEVAGYVVAVIVAAVAYLVRNRA